MNINKNINKKNNKMKKTKFFVLRFIIVLIIIQNIIYVLYDLLKKNIIDVNINFVEKIKFI
jgi:hypothetical protein